MNSNIKVLSLGASLGLIVGTIASIVKGFSLPAGVHIYVVGVAAGPEREAITQSVPEIQWVVPAITIAIGGFVSLLVAKLTGDKREANACKLFFMAMIVIALTAAGFQAYQDYNSEVEGRAGLTTAAFLQAMQFAAPIGALVGGIVWWLYWKLQQHLPRLAETPAIVALPLIALTSGASVWLSFPPPTIPFTAERWQKIPGDREEMFRALLSSRPLKGENIKEIEKLLGPSEAPDPADPAGTQPSNNYYFTADGTLLTVHYDKSTGLINDWQTKPYKYPVVTSMFIGEPLPEALDSDGKKTDWTKQDFRPFDASIILIDGKKYETENSKHYRIQKPWEKAGHGISLPAAGATDLKSGDYFICGGYDEKGESAGDSYVPQEMTNRTWIMSAKTGKLRPGPDMHTARFEPAAITLHDGRVLIVGGDHDVAVSSCEIFDPTTNSITSAGNLLIPRRDFGIGQLNNGDVLIVSGSACGDFNDQNTEEAGFELTSTVELIQIKPNSTVHLMVGNLKTARRSPTVVPYKENQAIIVAGEQGLETYRHAERYVGLTSK